MMSVLIASDLFISSLKTTAYFLISVCYLLHGTFCLNLFFKPHRSLSLFRDSVSFSILRRQSSSSTLLPLHNTGLVSCHSPLILFLSVLFTYLFVT
uniref:Uncharacterized protein n=1 Tax=Panstrongylus lignarius TaxID=156445 RepID=A0A224Y1Q7_9HEMI